MDKDKKLSAWYSLHQKSNPEDKVIMVVNNGNGLFEDCYGGCMKIGEVGHQFESVVERYPHLSRMPSTPSVRPTATLTPPTTFSAITETPEALVGHLSSNASVGRSDGSWADTTVPEKKKGRGRPKGSKNKPATQVAQGQSLSKDQS